VVRARAVAAAGFAALGLVFAPLGQALADQAASPPAAGDPGKGKALFASAMCGSCHVLADAGAAGQIGPSLDHDANLDTALVVSRVTNGQSSMPPFGDQFSEQEIADIAAYVVKAAAK